MPKRAHVPGLSWRNGIAYWQRQHKRMGRVYKSLGTSIESRAVQRAAALNTLIERGDWETIALWQADKLRIEDIAAASRRGDWHRLEAATAPTLQELVESYLARDLEPSTVAGYSAKLGALLQRFTTVSPGEISAVEAQQWLHASGWARSTQGKARTLFGSVWVHGGLRNIWQEVQLGTLPQPKVKFLTHQQWDSALAATANSRERLVLGLGALAGLRQGEIRHLRLEDVNLFAAQVRVVARQNPHAWKPKYGKERVVPIAEELMMLFRHYKQHGEVYWLEVEPGQPIGETTLKQWVAGIMQRAGLAYGRRDGFTAHSLRHSFGTWLAAAGVGLPTIAGLMGIGTKVAAQYYMHAMPGEAERAIAKLTTLTQQQGAKLLQDNA